MAQPPPLFDPGPDSTPDISQQTIFTVNVILCSLSLVGSLGMIVPFVVSPTYRRLRHRLIFGLAVSDLVTALVILVPSCIGLANATPENDAACRTAGFLYLTVVIGAAFWTLSIAITTFALLVYPISRFTDILSKRRTTLIMGLVYWGAGAIVTGAGYAVYGFQRTSTICFFGDNSGQFGNLVLLAPRVIVFTVVIALYLRLFFFFRSNSSITMVVSDFDEDMPSQPPEDAYSPLQNGSSFSDASKEMTAVPEPAATVPACSTALFGTWSWKGDGEGPLAPRKGSKDSQALLLGPGTPTGTPLRRLSERRGSGQSTLSRLWPLTPLHAPTPRRPTPGGISWSTEVAWKSDNSSAPMAAASLPEPPQSPKSMRSPLDPAALTLSPPTPDISSLSSSPQPATPSSDPEKQSPSPPSPPIRKSSARRKGAASAATSPVSRSSELALALTRTMSRTRSRLAGAASAAPSPPLQPSPSRPRAPTIPSGQEIVAAGDAKRRLSERKASMLPPGAELPLDVALQADAEANAPPGRRMSAQEMNRRASTLMLLYPLAYVVLFSVSIGRLINDISVGQSHAPNEWLTALSKWFIYASGLVDCIVFLVIEGGVRRYYH